MFVVLNLEYGYSPELVVTDTYDQAVTRVKRMIVDAICNNCENQYVDVPEFGICGYVKDLTYYDIITLIEKDLLLDKLGVNKDFNNFCDDDDTWHLDYTYTYQNIYIYDVDDLK